MQKTFDISTYLVVGPENTPGGTIQDVVACTLDAVRAGFTCVQIRSKTASARELIACVAAVDSALQRDGLRDKVTLLVDDRLDVVCAARAAGAHVDGIHVGQSDIPAAVCRSLLGEDATVGITAPTLNPKEYAQNVDTRVVDYIGIGPVHATPTKTDCGRLASGEVAELSSLEIAAIVKDSPLPVVVGGGVKLNDIAMLRSTGAAGFFVVSAITAAQEPYAAAKKLVDAWCH